MEVFVVITHIRQISAISKSDNVSYEEGAMVEALAVVVHACRRVNVHVGQNVLVCGAGPVGLMSFLCAKAFGAVKVFITDINHSRLDLAKKLGVDGVYLIDPKTFNDKEAAKTIVEEMGEAPDISIECSGVESSISMAIFATKSGGKVGIVGLGPKARVPLSSAAMREVDLNMCETNFLQTI
jgi:L-iditol 2-dehydrogenase